MSEKTASSGFPSVQSLLNQPLGSEDAGSTGGTSEYEPSNSQSCSNGFRESTANTQSTSEPRSTPRLFGPGQPMPTTTTRVGCMPSPGGSSLVNSSQPMNVSFPAIDDPSRKPNLGGRTASSTEPSYMCEAPRNTTLQSMGSQPSDDATGGFSSPKSAAATSHSQPSTASLEADIHPPPTTAVSPQRAQWNQDLPVHPQGMQPHLGPPLSENAAPLYDEGVQSGGMRATYFRGDYFRGDQLQYHMTLPGSEQVISVPVDLAQASKKADNKRKKNAEASTKHRKKKKEEIAENLKELNELRKEKKELEEKVKYLEEIIRRVPSLCHLVQEPHLAPQASNITIGMDGLATWPLGPKAMEAEVHQANGHQNVAELTLTPTHGASLEPATSRRLFELPLRTSPKNTPTRWFMPQDARILTPSSTMSSVW